MSAPGLENGSKNRGEKSSSSAKKRRTDLLTVSFYIHVYIYIQHISSLYALLACVETAPIGALIYINEIGLCAVGRYRATIIIPTDFPRVKGETTLDG